MYAALLAHVASISLRQDVNMDEVIADAEDAVTGAAEVVEDLESDDADQAMAEAIEAINNMPTADDIPLADTPGLPVPEMADDMPEDVIDAILEMPLPEEVIEAVDVPVDDLEEITEVIEAVEEAIPADLPIPAAEEIADVIEAVED